MLGGTATPSNGQNIIRNMGAGVFIPRVDEWYKAAYYKSGGTNAGYWIYATQSDTEPMSTVAPGTANSANVRGANGYAVTGSMTYDSNQVYVTNVAAYDASVSAYGTYDQTGNVWEWNEDAYLSGLFHFYRGGSWGDVDVGMRSLDENGGVATAEYADLGFRIAGVPEPTGMPAILVGVMLLCGRGRFPGCLAP